jgi:phage terminase large subunit-like protein
VGRGWGKSALVTNARCTQRLLQNPNWCIGIANERQDNANAFLGGIKANFESNDFLRFLFPECLPDNFRDVEWRSDRIQIKRTIRDAVNPSVLAAGVGATVTGVHMNEWLVDDVISQDAAENARAGAFTEIEKTNRWIVRLMPLLKNPYHDPITFIGTPWWLGDCYDFIAEQFGGDDEPVQHLWTVELPGGGQQQLVLEQRGQLAIFRMPAIDPGSGQPFFPEQFDLETLDSIRKIDPVFFAAQYLLQPGAGDASDFNEAWLKEYEWESNGKQIRYRGLDGVLHYDNVRDLTIIISADPAISDREGSARSAVNVVGTNGEQLFLLEAWAGRVGATGLAEKIMEYYTQYKASYIVIEAVAYQEALGDVLELLAKQYHVAGRLPIYEHKTGGNMKKDVRIKGMEPYFRKGFFYVHKSSQQDFLDEYRGFPYVKLRDMLDALSFQKELWERLATRDSAREPNAVKNRRQQEKVKVSALKDRYSRRQRYRRPDDQSR